MASIFPRRPIFAGQFIWKANDAIIALLRERGVLLADAKITHSYPHCWRHKTPGRVPHDAAVVHQQWTRKACVRRR